MHVQGLMPWRASQKSLKIIVDEDKQRAIPGYVSNESSCPFRADSTGKVVLKGLKTNVLINMCGPVGVYYINKLDIHYEYKEQFSTTLMWLYQLRARSLNDSGFYVSRTVQNVQLSDKVGKLNDNLENINAAIKNTRIEYSTKPEATSTIQKLKKDIMQQWIRELDINANTNGSKNALSQDLMNLITHNNKRLDAIYDEYTYGVENLVYLEYLMPSYFCTFNLHLLVHFVDTLAYCGPVYGTWMFTFERYINYIKGYIKSSKSMEETLARAVAFNEVLSISSDRIVNDKIQFDRLEPYMQNMPENRNILVKHKMKNMKLSVNENNGMFTLLQNFLIKEDGFISILHEEFKSSMPSIWNQRGMCTRYIYIFI